eukprot:scaffold205655_cov32-Tisochrysis_lutea.AAC.1
MATARVATASRIRGKTHHSLFKIPVRPVCVRQARARAEQEKQLARPSADEVEQMNKAPRLNDCCSTTTEK